MIWLRRGLIVIFALIVLAFVGFNLFKKQIAANLFERVTDRRVGIDFAAQLPDGLHIYICGAGSPMPDTSRAGPCLGVLAGDRAYRLRAHRVLGLPDRAAQFLEPPRAQRVHCRYLPDGNPSGLHGHRDRCGA